MCTPTVLYLVADACTCLTVYGEFYGWQRWSKIVIVGLYKLFNICQKFNKFIRFKSERHTTKTARFSHCVRGLEYIWICTFFYENLAWKILLPCSFKMRKKKEKKEFRYSLFVIWSCGSHFVTTHSGTNFVIRVPHSCLNLSTI